MALTDSPTDAAKTHLVELMRRVIAHEAHSLLDLEERIDESVADVVERIVACTGRMIVAGVGKSGLIGRKIAATFCSTGTPAAFLHPVEAFHGDLGIVQADDILMGLSASGETAELLECVSWVKRMGVTTVAVTCRPESSLAVMCDVALDLGVQTEACPLQIAPMSSTTAMAALGDALAAGVAHRRGFTSEHFAHLHPGGALGRRLLLRVGEVMHTGAGLPLVPTTETVRNCIFEMSRKRLGAAFLVGPAGELDGILTDGDLRRLFERIDNPLDLPVSQFMTARPVHTTADRLATETLRLMQTRAVTILPVLDHAGRPVGALHLHDLLKAGLS